MDTVVVYWIFWSSRWLFNLSYLRMHPFIVALGTDALDLFDTPLWKLTGGSSEDYNRYDKLADVTYYIASLIYVLYFFNCLRWPRAVLYLITVFLSYRIVGNFIMVALPNITWLPIVFANIGSLLLEVYAGLDFFRLNRHIEHSTGWNVVIVILVVCAKIGQEVGLRLAWDGLSSSECDSIAHCFGIWWFPMFAFLLIGIWVGYMRWPDWYANSVTSRSGVFVRL